MSKVKITYCRSCGAELIVCANNNTGKTAPINRRPDKTGNITIEFDKEGYIVPIYTVHSKNALRHLQESAQAGKVDLYKSHFATCPDAKHFRKKKQNHRKR